MSDVQAIIFNNKKWTVSKSLKWLDDHDISPMKIHETTNHIRYRLIDPKKFSHFITNRRKNGISFIIGFY